MRLLEGIRSGLERLFDLVVPPLLEIVGAQDGDKSPHVGMTQTTELRAGDLVLEFGIPGSGPHLGGRDVGDEPDRDREAGHGVLLYAELRHAEAVDDILASQLHDDRLVDRQGKLIYRGEGVFWGRGRG